MSLRFEEILPDESLSHIIRRFFVIEYTAEEPRKDFLLPDGTPSFFYLNPVSGKFQAVFHDKEEVFELKEGMYVGFGNTLMEYQHQKLRIIGVNVYPIYLSILFELTPDRLMNGFAHLDQLDLPDSLDWSQMATQNEEEVIEKIKSFIRNRIRQNTFGGRFNSLYQKIIEPRGHQVKVEDLADWLGYSTRYLGDLFRKHLGMSPKKFLELARFNHALKMMDELGGRLTQVAQEAGYHDQAHFIRDFKKICGKTPGELLVDPNSLAHKFRFF